MCKRTLKTFIYCEGYFCIYIRNIELFFSERNDRAPKFNRYELSNDLTLKEDQIGITEYVTPGSGFTGVIKHRISDFQVSEVDLDGVIAKLTDIKPPIPPEGNRNNEKKRRNVQFIIDISITISR